MKNHQKTINDKPLKMHPNNIVIIASSSRELYDLLELTRNNGYNTNSDILRLDNGDFSVVISRDDE